MEAIRWSLTIVKLLHIIIIIIITRLIQKVSTISL